MKVLYSWLQDFVTLDIPVDTVVQKLIMTGLEVTHIEKIDNDWLLDIEVTPNRPDCLSVMGIARECALALNRRFKPLRAMYVPRTSAAYIKENGFEIVVEDKDACPRYIGRILLNVEIKTSPDFIKRRLEKVGLRAINNVVDITNYILLELGQPMHAFDYDKIAGKKIIVRYAREGEKIVTLDGEERTLVPQDLVIADVQKPLALAGVMGGKTTEVTEDTTNILLESAYFHPLTIRKSSQRQGLITESSYRFERGVDFPTVDLASRYAVELIRRYASWDKKKPQVLIDKSLDVVKKQIPLSKKVVLKFSDIEKLLGIMPSTFWVRKLIRNLGCEIVSLNKEELKIQAPSFRQDLKESVDYIEEIARFYGYDKIPEKELPDLYIENEFQLDKFGERDFENKIREILIKMGMSEVITYALISQEEVEKFNFRDVLPLEKPLTQNYAVLRPSLLPSILKVAQYNFSRSIYNLAIFELGKIYTLKDKPREGKVVGLLFTGDKYKDYFGNDIEYNFYDLKSVVEELLTHFGIEHWEIQESPDLIFSPACSAKLVIDREEQGVLGKIAPEIAEFYDLKNEIYLAQINLEFLKEGSKRQIRYQEPLQYPYILRDISLLISRDIPAGEILKVVKKSDILIQEVNVIDIYQGKQIPSDKISLTIRIKFQSPERTLKDEEVDVIMERLQRLLLEKFSCQIRK